MGYFPGVGAFEQPFGGPGEGGGGGNLYAYFPKIQMSGGDVEASI